VLEDLAGYRIYYGTALGSYPNVETVTGGGVLTYTIDNLPAGTTWFFTATAVDASNNESEQSNVASKTISN
jgi:hypothetical protein